MADNRVHNWTDERVDVLKHMIKDGSTCSERARALGGVTRNAVIGKVLRMGLRMAHAKRKPRVYTPPAKRPRSIKNRTVQIVKDNLPLPTVQADDIARVSLFDLDAHHCRFPVGNNPGPDKPHYCGSDIAVGMYCHDHARRCFNGPQVRPRVGKPSATVRVRQFEDA
jgi:GcrA cell cycle regulator